MIQTFDNHIFQMASKHQSILDLGCFVHLGETRLHFPPQLAARAEAEVADKEAEVSWFSFWREV